MVFTRCTPALIAACGLLSFGAVTAGCGGGSSAAPQTIVRSNVIVLPSGTTITALSANSVTLGGQVPAIRQGDVLVSDPRGAAAQGILVNVTAPPSVTGGGTVVQTSPASLQDVFILAAIHVHQTFAASQLTVRSVRPGFAISLSHGTPRSGATRDPSNLALAGTLAGSGASAVTVSGSASITVTDNLDCVIRQGTVQSADASPTIVGSSNATVTGNFSGAGPGTSVLVGSLTSAPQVQYVGPVPVVTTVVVNVYATVGGNLRPGVTFTVANAYTLGDGLSYAPSTGLTTVPAFQHANDALTNPGDPYAALAATATAFGPQVGLQLYNYPVFTATWSATSVALTYTRTTSATQGPGTQEVAVGTYTDTLALNGAVIGAGVPVQTFPAVTNVTVPLYNQFTPDNASVGVGVQ